MFRKKPNSLYGYAEFKSSNGWLSKIFDFFEESKSIGSFVFIFKARWKSRHNLSFVSMNGESEKVDMSCVETWIKQLRLTIAGYEPGDIFNADETELSFRCLPSKILNPRVEQCYNGEISKERITLLFFCNMSGEKLSPLVIGKSG